MSFQNRVMSKCHHQLMADSSAILKDRQDWIIDLTIKTLKKQEKLNLIFLKATCI